MFKLIRRLRSRFRPVEKTLPAKLPPRPIVPGEVNFYYRFDAETYQSHSQILNRIRPGLSDNAQLAGGDTVNFSYKFHLATPEKVFKCIDDLLLVASLPKQNQEGRNATLAEVTYLVGLVDQLLMALEAAQEKLLD